MIKTSRLPSHEWHGNRKHHIGAECSLFQYLPGHLTEKRTQRLSHRQPLAVLEFTNPGGQWLLVDPKPNDAGARHAVSALPFASAVLRSMSTTALGAVVTRFIGTPFGLLEQKGWWHAFITQDRFLAFLGDPSDCLKNCVRGRTHDERRDNRAGDRNAKEMPNRQISEPPASAGSMEFRNQRSDSAPVSEQLGIARWNSESFTVLIQPWSQP